MQNNGIQDIPGDHVATIAALGYDFRRANMNNPISGHALAKRFADRENPIALYAEGSTCLSTEASDCEAHISGQGRLLYIQDGTIKVEDILTVSLDPLFQSALPLLERDVWRAERFIPRRTQRAILREGRSWSIDDAVVLRGTNSKSTLCVTPYNNTKLIPIPRVSDLDKGSLNENFWRNIAAHLGQETAPLRMEGGA